MNHCDSCTQTAKMLGKNITLGGPQVPLGRAQGLVLGLLEFMARLKGLYWEPQTGNPKNIVGI